MIANTIKSSRLIKATPFFYGWVILAVGTIGIIMMAPSQTFTISVFIDYFITDLGISRANISLLYGLATFAASLLLPLIGRLVDRYGPRLMTPLIALCLGLAAMGTALVQGVVSLLIGLLALRFLGFGSLQLVSNNLIAQWFIRRRGRVMGLAGLSLPIGLMIFPGLSQFLIQQFGWRWAMALLGLLVWLVMLPISLLFFKDRPELYGLQPDGDALPEAGSLRYGSSERNWTLAEARRTGVFWLFSAGLTVLTMLLAGLVFHQTSLFEVRGLSRETAVNAFYVIAIFSVVGNLGMGWLLDRYRARLLLAITLFLLAATMVMVMVMTTPAEALIYGALSGLVSGAFRVIDAVVWAKYFGRLHLGSIRGAVMIGVVGGTALGPYPLGLSLDALGSYAPALTGLMVLPLGIGLAALLIKRPERQAN
ncbi:MAG TPA: MFS transporter [Anaerolineae bacterium]|nr:MFS transporter [Anaerolineae bacterium]